MFKNLAGQKQTFFAFNTTTNAPVTGDAANITAYYDLDDAGVTVLTDTSATEKDATNAKGYYVFDLAQAETNGNKILFSAKSSTANVVVVACPPVVFTQPTTGILAPTTAGRTLTIESDGMAHADLKEWLGTAPAALASQLVRVSVGAIDDALLTAAKFASGAFDAVWSVTSRTLSAFGFSVTVGTNSDKTGYELTSAYDPAKTASQAGDAMALTSGERTSLAAVIWNSLTSGLSTANSIGKLLVDNINATIGSRSSHSASDVWAVVSRTLTAFSFSVAVSDKTGFSLTSEYDPAKTAAQAGDIPSVGAIADQVWDEALSGHQTAGTAGKALSDAGAGGTPATPAEIADAVWDESASAHNTAGTMGNKMNSAASAGDPWSTLLPGSYGPGEAGYIVGNNLDAQISDLLGGATPTPSYSDDCGDVRTFDAGEKKPVYVSLASTGGTFTISSAKVYLQTAAGAAVGTLTNIDATGFDAGALTTARAWFNLNTAAPNGADSALAVGTYELLFVISGTGSDGIARTHEIPVVIQVV